MIGTYSLLVLQKAMNHALALDESMPAKLKALHGKVLEIIISPLNLRFFMCFESGEILLRTHHATVADTIIHSSPLGLIRLSLLPASNLRSLFNDKIKISGDMELGQAVKALVDEIDIDWEGHLAQFTGDVVAYRVGSFVRQGREFKQHLQQSVCRDITEYLQEECRLFPPPEEVGDFFNDVDELALRVERLSARLNQWIRAV